MFLSLRSKLLKMIYREVICHSHWYINEMTSKTEKHKSRKKEHEKATKKDKLSENLNAVSKINLHTGSTRVELIL